MNAQHRRSKGRSVDIILVTITVLVLVHVASAITSPNRNPTRKPLLRASRGDPESNRVLAADPYANQVINPGFEDGLTGWNSWSDSSLSVSTTVSHSGSASALVHGRTAVWHGLYQSMLGLIDPTAGATYHVSAWARLGSPGTELFRMQFNCIDDIGSSWPLAARTYITENWTYVEGTVTLALMGTPTRLILEAWEPSPPYNFYVDDVSVTLLTNAPTAQPSTSPSIPPSSDASAAPSPAPSPAPSLAPTSAPTQAPTPFSYNGPFVSIDNSSEVVTIPRPPAPGEGELFTGIFRTGCPHLGQGLLNWHDDSTWNTTHGQVPTSGDVTLPENSLIVVTQSIVEELGIITIPITSELIFAENHSAPITLDATGIDVQGALRAGDESCRYETELAITLHGERPTDYDIFGVSPTINATTYKGISVDGILSLHGRRYYPTWSRLAQSVPVGQSILLLQEPVNWEPFSKIVLVSTALHDSRSWHQNEVLTIASIENNPVAGVGAAVHLTSAVQYHHIANDVYQAEVGLLTRNIKIQGAAGDSEPTDPDPNNCTGPGLYPPRHYGDDWAPCQGFELTGFGGHIMVRHAGRGYVEGIELERMGQTNVLGRYPMHFHMVGNCPGCRFSDSSIHRSYFRCISIHSSHNTTVSENVAYDITGSCYYLEDGVEEDNTLSFNLGHHIHFPGGNVANSWHGGQRLTPFPQAVDLINPGDATSSAFWLTNLNNNIVGNAAGGGWSGYAMPHLEFPIGPNRDLYVRPGNALVKTFDGNTAHSTGWFWDSAAGFYFGGTLYYSDPNRTLLEYNPGRDHDRLRDPCSYDTCEGGNCNHVCVPAGYVWNIVTNNKAFLTPSVGLLSWWGRMEVRGFESHDVGLGLRALENTGFGIDRLLVQCRSGENLETRPNSYVNQVPGSGFNWYDTGSEHIITNAVFRNCGYREGYNHYDASPTSGCINCRQDSSTFGCLTHSDQYNPEIMQATANITYQNCGRRYSLVDPIENNNPSTVSGRTQNWLDTDGSASGLGEPTIIGSGLADAGAWWTVGDTVHDPQGPLEFIRVNDGPERGLAHVRVVWDDDLYAGVGTEYCANGDRTNYNCTALGEIRHIGSLFNETPGLPVTAASDIAGPTGGFGWLLDLDGGSPRQLLFSGIEVDASVPLLFAIPYPPGTNFTVTAHAFAASCYASPTITCTETFQPAESVAHVRHSAGNKYFYDVTTHLLWVRLIEFPSSYTGDPGWQLYDLDTLATYNTNYNQFALLRYTFTTYTGENVTLPKSGTNNYIEIIADCPAEAGSTFCTENAEYSEPQVCSESYPVQVSYDKCCTAADATDCEEYTPPPTSSPTMAPTPTPEPTQDPYTNRVINPGFEDGLTGWSSNSWGGSSLSVSTDVSYSGSASAWAHGRTAVWHGLYQNMIGLLNPNVGATYHVSAWARLGSPGTEFLRLQINYNDDTGAGQIMAARAYITENWTYVEGTMTLSLTGNPTLLRLEIWEPSVGFDFYVDDVSILLQ